MTWFVKLSNSFKVTIISGFLTVIAFLGMVFGYFINQPGLPNGVLAGGFLGTLSYLLMGLVEKRDENRNSAVLTIIVTILRFILIGALLIVAALLEYKFNNKMLNVLAVLGGYLISLIVYLVVILLEKKHV